ncbi:glutathione S-transferase 3, mitochondrial-like isoform X1 [Lineus longissimus]|uniref:glutathione S-transferase 3, mitochondrial-like isoform X1 n=1 Tax=Lineus longissimus TaxID=88925 RepID=UPI002B4F3087
MVVYSKIHTVLPDGYAFVVMTGVASGIVNAWHMSQVMKARKEHKIEYPALYSPTNNDFNCVQRAHQNYLENQPQFLMILFLGGLQYPKISAAAGMIYLAGRVAYAIGYSSGDPKKRMRGGFGYIGMFALLGASISFAYHLGKASGFSGLCTPSQS